ncbi:cysteine hydrolase [Roseomonas sp. AR75]|uniref:cysteine hydrolase n=1 Tax=Roseomonas sp. AR75 TaxID=2562311 RepID=UPI0010C09E13|nr:cysteine hydrolase [Roseomonas sp. AR75]
MRPEAIFPAELLARVRARRGGRVHVTTRLDPARTALVVVDMQLAFTQQGAPSGTGDAPSIVPAINAVAAALRAAGGHVAFSRGTFDASADGGWPAFYRRMVEPGLAQRILEGLREGHPLHALDPGLEVAAGDFVFPKCRYSAFGPGASPLPDWLKGREVTTVLVAGTLTNVCCESTARDAMQHGYDTVMIADANAARDRAAHQATLNTFLEFFGDVLAADQVIALLQGGAMSD